jgi:hypothetical protein
LINIGVFEVAIARRTYSKIPMGKTWRLLVWEAVAPMNAPPVTRPLPEPGVSTTFSGTPFSMVFPWTTKFPSLTEILGVTVIFQHLIAVSPYQKIRSIRWLKTLNVLIFKKLPKNITEHQILYRNITTSNEHKFYQFIKYKTKNK